MDHEQVISQRQEEKCRVWNLEYEVKLILRVATLCLFLKASDDCWYISFDVFMINFEHIYTSF